MVDVYLEKKYYTIGFPIHNLGYIGMFARRKLGKSCCVPHARYGYSITIYLI